MATTAQRLLKHGPDPQDEHDGDGVTTALPDGGRVAQAAIGFPDGWGQ